MLDIDLSQPILQDSLRIKPYRYKQLVSDVETLFKHNDTLTGVLFKIDSNKEYTNADKAFAIFLMGFIYNKIVNQVAKKETKNEDNTHIHNDK